MNAAVSLLSPLFHSISRPLPPVHVSCGWPAVGGTRRKRRVIGECWERKMSKDGVNHIFISPLLDEPISDDEGGGVLETLTHELCHAVDDGESKHGSGFRKIATAIGLEGKMTSTHAGEDLVLEFKRVMEELGPYPHARLNIELREKQSTRMKKVECPCCGYAVRTTRKWLEIGLPSCPFGTEMELQDPLD